MLTDLCQELRNWFCSDDDKTVGDYTISGGVITPSADIQENQYFRIVGSVFNDGVHQYANAEDALVDESFHGAVWKMKIPKEVLLLSEKIDQFNSGASAVITPFVSESFGGYTYTKGTKQNGASITWREAFGSDLNRWRKI